uniref:MULE transposase domain-containing protein n=1 Tax=Plectus sambesii TaxID=2011161 RepID=A0A914WW79_9BILA
MWNGEHVFKVAFQPSKTYDLMKRALHPIAIYWCSPTDSYTFSYVDKSKDNKLYYTCNQCVAAKRKSRVGGAKGRTIHIADSEVINGDPAAEHYPGCVPICSTKVFTESKKRKGAQLVRSGLSTVSSARINIHAEMTRACEQAGVGEDEARLQWSTKSFTNRLSHAKLSCIPPLTASGDLPDQLKLTNTGQQFLRYESPDGGKLFVDDAGLSFLELSTCWKGDGTFKSAPKGYLQVYTLHARHPRGESVPIVHMLLKGKTYDDYFVMFEFLNHLLEERSGSGSIGALSTALFDYEPAPLKAFKSAFKATERNIKVHGCRFHYGQAVIRNIDSKGLKTVKNKAEVAK